MPSWRHRISGSITGLLVLASIAYPGLVYFGRDKVHPVAYVALAVALIALRLLMASSSVRTTWRLPLTAVAGSLMLAAMLDGIMAAKLYPVLLSLAATGVFGASLLQPTTLVEKIALLREPNLPPKGRSYCRRVTAIWAIWLAVNAAIAAILAIYGTEAAWALWTGLLSYLAMGLLFAGEYAVRLRMQRVWKWA